MNDQKLKKLFDAARHENAPVPSEDFELNVLRALDREPARERESLADQLAALFPRLACAAVLTIGLFVGGDFLMTAFHLPSLSDGVAQISNQWLLTGNGI